MRVSIHVNVQVVLAALLCGVALPGCGSQPGIPPNPAPHVLPETSAAFTPLGAASTQYLYVANSSWVGTDVFAPGKVAPLRIYPGGGHALAFDGAGKLYVGGGGVGGSSVNVYAFGKTKLLRTINAGNGATQSLTVDSSGVLYVTNSTGGPYNLGDIAVVPPRRSLPSRTITTGINAPNCVRVDASRDLYVSNAGSNAITVFDAGGSSPMRTITSGIANPDALLLDTAGNLYVANQGAWTGKKFVKSSVTVYAPGGSTPTQTITNGIAAPDALAFDSSGNLYVANRPPFVQRGGSVTEYSGSNLTLKRTIVAGIDKPAALAIDLSGSLYVANAIAFKTGSVTVYPPGQVRPSQTITTNLLRPDALGLNSK